MRKPEGRRPLGRGKLRWMDNIKIDHRETGCGGMDWINQALARDKWRTLMNLIMNFRVP
jgi:hypothetical protein